MQGKSELVDDTFNREVDGYYDKAKEEAPIVVGALKQLPIRVQLLSPVRIGSTVYPDLTISAYPTVGDLAHLPIVGEVQKFGHYVPMLATVCEVPEEVINRLIPKDYQRLMLEVNDFLS
jgi:hypothetical protein